MLLVATTALKSSSPFNFAIPPPVWGNIVLSLAFFFVCLFVDERVVSFVSVEVNCSFFS